LAATADHQVPAARAGSEAMSLLAELKRRNVIRMAGLYLVGAWLVTQVASTVFPAFDVPGWVLRALIIVLVLGFVPALIFSWVFELTPEGLKRDAEVKPGESIAPSTARQIDRLIIVVLICALVYFAVDKFLLTSRRDNVAATPATATSEQVKTVPLAANAIPEIDKDPSIAVLPLVNMSSDKEQEYFSDGISEELLNLLAKVPKLRVIARTSSFSFKGKEVAIPEIARALNVAALLEGSVRKSGDKVRITVQLIRASDSSHLWSETYDRTLDDIFKVQDEIAATVADKLKITLLGAAPTAKPIDPKVYPLILQAKSLSYEGTIKGYAQAVALYQQALSIAPAEARAWDGLARAYASQTSLGERVPVEGYALAREAADKALAIDPNDALAFAALGRITMEFDGDLPAAARHFQRALALEPANLDVLRSAALFMNWIGRQDDAIAIFEYLIAHDPANPAAYSAMTVFCYTASRWDQAIESARTELTLSHDSVGAQYFIGMALLLGKSDAVAALAAMQAESSEVWRMSGLPVVYHALGREADSEAALAAFIDKHAQDQPYAIAVALAYRGDADRAFDWLDKAVAAHDASLPYVPVDPFLAKLHGDARWLPFLHQIGRAPEQLAQIEFKVTLPDQGASR
jgi:TolB-like protein